MSLETKLQFKQIDQPIKEPRFSLLYVGKMSRFQEMIAALKELQILKGGTK